MTRKFLVSIILLLNFIQISKAQDSTINLSDSAKISILSSAPWPAQIYAVFGHSSIRVQDPARELNGNTIDVVFNYGVFDFKSSNFLYRFMAGETDYIVVDVPTNYYLPEYERRGTEVYEQVINLTLEEKQKIWEYLLHNIKLENRVYRYNIFYNNCTTKLRDILEENIQGQIIYPNDDKIQTHRSMVHEHLTQQPWLKFGIDIILGNNSDKNLTIREKIFLPIYEMNIFDHSVIKNADGQTKPFVLHDEVVVHATDNVNDLDEQNIFSPIVVGILFLVLALILSICSYKKSNTIANLFDFLLFFIAGIGGIIIFFMMFFSVHPGTSANWNIVWLNPLHFFIAFLFFAKSLSKYVYYYHFINFATLTLFLLAWCLIPQQLEIAFIPFILTIWLRSGLFVVQIRKTKNG